MGHIEPLTIIFINRKRIDGYIKGFEDISVEGGDGVDGTDVGNTVRDGTVGVVRIAREMMIRVG